MTIEKLYRKRIIPSECILLKDDEIVYLDDTVLITKWKTLKPKAEFDHGASAYIFEKGIKVSKFYKPDGTLRYWYCDVVNYDINIAENTCTTTDLLVDVVVYPDGSSRILDLDELADAHEKGLVDNNTLYEALKRADKLVSDIYAGNFNIYRDLVDYMEKHNVLE